MLKKRDPQPDQRLIAAIERIIEQTDRAGQMLDKLRRKISRSQVIALDPPPDDDGGDGLCQHLD
ncbi:MAG: hypothetical protein ACFB6S_15770 [Geminicoccaceae bacterium]